MYVCAYVCIYIYIYIYIYTHIQAGQGIRQVHDEDEAGGQSLGLGVHAALLALIVTIVSSMIIVNNAIITSSN